MKSSKLLNKIYFFILPFFFCNFIFPKDQYVLKNPSFEHGVKEIPGWKIILGARISSKGKSAKVFIDTKKSFHGKHSLCISADRSTVKWPCLVQKINIKPGVRIEFEVMASCENVKKIGKQYFNCNGILIFFSKNKRIIKKAVTNIIFGTRDWCKLYVHTIAPDKSSFMFVGLSFTLSGKVWFDDAKLTISETKPFSKEVRETTFSALKKKLLRTYPFWTIPGKPNPFELFKRYEKKAITAKTLDTYLKVIKNMLKELRDVHIWFEINGKIVPIKIPPKGYKNWNIEYIKKTLTKITNNNAKFFTGIYNNNIGYMLLKTFAMTKDEINAAETALESLFNCDALIIDVRPNTGGQEKYAMRIASRFISSPTLYAMHRYRDPCNTCIDGFFPPQKRILYPHKNKKVFMKKVILLQGPYCVSSTEAFLLMMKATKHVVTLGLPSRGASGNPGPFDLFPHIKIWIPRWQSLTPKGECIEGKGIEPDIKIDPGPKSFEKEDPVFRKAVESL